MSLKKSVVFIFVLIFLFSVSYQVSATEKMTVEEIKGILDQLPSLDELTTMPSEEQSDVYEQVQLAYAGYQALSEEERAALGDAEEIFQNLLDYFNSKVMAVEETAMQEEPVKEGGMPWGLTALILAVVITFLQSILIHGRR